MILTVLPGPSSRSTIFDDELTLRRSSSSYHFALNNKLGFELCRTLGSNNLSLHHYFDLMSSPIDYIFMNSRDKGFEIVNILSSSRISIGFMMRNTILASMNCIIIDHFIAFPPTQACSCLVLYLEFLAVQQLIFLTSEVLPSLFVKDVVRISPPLNNSWYHNTSCHLRSFLGPRIVFNRNTDIGAMTCEF